MIFQAKKVFIVSKVDYNSTLRQGKRKSGDRIGTNDITG